MTLLYLALAYMAGILAGRILYDWLGLACPLPGWLWLIPLALLPLTLLFTRKPEPATAPLLRWPMSAGFEIPVERQSLALAVAVMLCLASGALRYAGQPYTRCWTPADLAYYNLPPDAAFDRSAPRATVHGYISSYPLVQDTDQQMVVTPPHSRWTAACARSAARRGSRPAHASATPTASPCASTAAWSSRPTSRTSPIANTWRARRSTA
jgi:hypothetical protein